MTTRIFVSPPTIENNAKTGRHDPTIAVNIDGEVRMYYEVNIEGPSKVVYDPDGKEKYGARVFIETSSQVVGVSNA
jgi:hypothetical protein